MPRSQVSVQQSVPAEHRPPDGTHRPTVEMQVCSTESQIPEQHSVPAPHDWPVVPHAPPPTGLLDKPPHLMKTADKTHNQKMRRYMAELPRP
jgi:hypothetical protein